MVFTAREMSLKSNINVLGYIQAENAKRDAQAKAEGWQFWTLMTESLADEYTNVYELELMLAECTYSDMHKEEYGCRPASIKGYTLEQLEEMIDELCEGC
jgi:hypothetical protein